MEGFITVTDTQGNEVDVRIESIDRIEVARHSQASITLRNGAVIQVQEARETIHRMIGVSSRSPARRETK